MKEIKFSELRRDERPPKPCPYQPTHTYQFTHYWLGDRCLGAVCVKKSYGRTTLSTLASGCDEKFSGASVSWMAEKNGFKLIY
jgi:hypothetical protein